MIEPAAKHEAALQVLFMDHAFDDRFKYYWSYSWRENYAAPKSTWDRMEWAVLENSKVVGLLGYSIDRDSLVVTNFSAINFCGSSLSFAISMIRVIDDLFKTFNFRKLRFSVEVGNPIEPSYDKMVNRYGGSVCGLWRAENKLFDGTITDRKWYEIMREDYLAARNNRHG